MVITRNKDDEDQRRAVARRMENGGSDLTKVSFLQVKCGQLSDQMYGGYREQGNEASVLGAQISFCKQGTQERVREVGTLPCSGLEVLSLT